MYFALYIPRHYFEIFTLLSVIVLSTIYLLLKPKNCFEKKKKTD